MPFMHGAMPLRRTFFYLEQGVIHFRKEVAVFEMCFHRKPNPAQQGAREFVFWHWAQLQYQNPAVQLVKQESFVPTPYGRAFLNDGRDVVFDLENCTREEIVDILKTTLGKTELVNRIEALEEITLQNPASLNETSERQCICEIQGQHACTSLLHAPPCMTGGWRWNHNNI